MGVSLRLKEELDLTIVDCCIEFSVKASVRKVTVIPETGHFLLQLGGHSRIALELARPSTLRIEGEPWDGKIQEDEA